MSEESKRKSQPRELHHLSKSKIIGERIADLRRESGLSLSQLGMKVGLGKSTLAGYEHGYRFPSIDKLEVIAKTLDTSTDYLLGLTDSKRHKDGKDLYQYLDTHGLVYDGEPLTEEQVETLNNFLKSFLLANRSKVREKIGKEIK